MPTSSPGPESSGDKAKAVFFILLCAAWILPGLIGHDPWKPDEAYTFGLVYHILRTGDWVVPTLAHEPFVEKPPFYYLTAALTAKLFSPPLALHDAARLATGFYMALTFLFTGLAGRELYGRGHGWLAAFCLMGSLGLLVRGHQLIPDASLLAGIALALYGLALSRRRPGAAGFALGTGVGVGFLSKGLIAPGLIGVTAALLPLLPPWRERRYLACLGIALAAAAPWLFLWPYALYQRSPELFNEWLWTNNFGRFLGFAHNGPNAEPFYYLKTLPWFAWPALPLTLWTLWHEGRKGLTQASLLLPLVAFLAMLAVLSLAREARDVYGLPLLLPLALLASVGVTSLRRGAANALYWFGIMGFTFFAGVFWFYWVPLEFGVPTRLASHLEEMQPGYASGFKFLPFAVALFYTLGWLALLARLKRSPERPVVVWAAGITLAWGVAMTLLVGYLDHGKSYRSMIASLKQALPTRYQCIASRSLGEPQRAMLEYYAGIVTQRLEKNPRARCDLLLVQGSAQSWQPPKGPWRQIWEGSRPGDTKERYVLYQRTPP